MSDRLNLVGMLVALFLIQGCVNLKPRENKIHFYVLGATSTQEQTSTSSVSDGISIGLKRLRLAEYLDTPYIVTRLGANEVRFAEFHRWGEDLGPAINRVVADYLSARPNIQRVDLVPWTLGARHDYEIQIQVLQFEGFLSGPESSNTSAMDVQLVAHWQIADAKTKSVIKRGTTDENLGDQSVFLYPSLVSGLESMLEKLSQDLIAALDEL